MIFLYTNLDLLESILYIELLSNKYPVFLITVISIIIHQTAIDNIAQIRKKEDNQYFAI